MLFILLLKVTEGCVKCEIHICRDYDQLIHLLGNDNTRCHVEAYFNKTVHQCGRNIVVVTQGDCGRFYGVAQKIDSLPSCGLLILQPLGEIRFVFVKLDCAEAV